MFANGVRVGASKHAEFTGDAFGRRRLFLPFLILVATIAVLTRIDHLSYVAESLFAEDANLFIDQAHELGLRSLLIPHYGYLFLYERAIGLLARPVPLVAIPYVFFCAWLLSFVLIPVVINSRARDAGLSDLATVFLVCAIALQPNYGEAFFNLNMSTYMFGLALAFHVCIPKEETPSLWLISFLVTASLTGPFSAFLLPILLLQFVTLRDFSTRKATYAIVTICGAIQLFFLVQRSSGFTAEVSAADWLQAISLFLLFGAGNKLTCMVAISFWGVMSIFLVMSIARGGTAEDRIQWSSPLFATAALLLLYLVAAWGAKSYISQSFLTRLSPIDVNARYLLAPYSLAFFVALACTRAHRGAQTIVIALISTICGAGFLTVDREERASHAALFPHNDLQWVAFTKFRELEPDVAIPVNPLWPMYPTRFSVDSELVGVGHGATAKSRSSSLLSPQEVTTGASATESARTWYFDIKDHCVESRYLALKIGVWRSRMGWAKVSWGQPERFDAQRSLERFYLDGMSEMQFAFRRDLSDSLIRFDPAEGVDAALVQTWSPVRERLRKAGVIVAEPTPPGGDVRIESVRLFCLD